MIEFTFYGCYEGFELGDDGGCRVVVCCDWGFIVDEVGWMRKKFVDLFWILFIVFLIFFSLFISYQAIRKIVGGSWNVEDLVLGFLVAIIGLLFGLVANSARLNSDIRHLRGQIFYLGRDFREHLNRHENW